MDWGQIVQNYKTLKKKTRTFNGIYTAGKTKLLTVGFVYIENLAELLHGIAASAFILFGPVTFSDLKLTVASKC